MLLHFLFKLTHTRFPSLSLPTSSLSLSLSLFLSLPPLPVPQSVHGELAKRLAAREPGAGPQLGERVAYVLTETGGKAAESAEDPLFALTNNLPVDVTW